VTLGALTLPQLNASGNYKALLEENCMSIMTHNHRLQARWTPTATAGGTATAATAPALSCTRRVGRFAASSKGMSGIDGVGEPGRANLGRNDT
jgi:hypothetical protein